MATKIKIIPANDFMEVTPDGLINVTTSRKLLVDIAKSEQPPADYELLVDFRNTQSNLSPDDVIQLASEVFLHGDAFRKKVALLVLPGANLNRARLFEICTGRLGFSINAFTDYENAMRWLLSEEDLPDNNVSPNKADASDGK